MSFKVEQGLGNRNDLIISDIESKYKEASATPSSSTKPKTETMLGKICVFVVDKAFNYSDEAILKGCPLLYAISKIAKKAEPYLQKTQDSRYKTYKGLPQDDGVRRTPSDYFAENLAEINPNEPFTRQQAEALDRAVTKGVFVLAHPLITAGKVVLNIGAICNEGSPLGKTLKTLMNTAGSDPRKPISKEFEENIRNLARFVKKCDKQFPNTQYQAENDALMKVLRKVAQTGEDVLKKGVQEQLRMDVDDSEMQKIFCDALFQKTANGWSRIQEYLYREEQQADSLGKGTSYSVDIAPPVEIPESNPVVDELTQSIRLMNLGDKKSPRDPGSETPRSIVDRCASPKTPTQPQPDAKAFGEQNRKIAEEIAAQKSQASNQFTPTPRPSTPPGGDSSMTQFGELSVTPLEKSGAKQLADNQRDIDENGRSPAYKKEETDLKKNKIQHREEKLTKKGVPLDIQLLEQKARVEKASQEYEQAKKIPHNGDKVSHAETTLASEAESLVRLQEQCRNSQQKQTKSVQTVDGIAHEILAIDEKIAVAKAEIKRASNRAHRYKKRWWKKTFQKALHVVANARDPRTVIKEETILADENRRYLADLEQQKTNFLAEKKALETPKIVQPEATLPGDNPSTRPSEPKGSEPGVTKQENGSPSSSTDAKPKKPDVQPEASLPGDKPPTKPSEPKGLEPGVTKQENNSPSSSTDAKPKKPDVQPDASLPGDKPPTKPSEPKGLEPGVTKQENGSPSPTDAKPKKTDAQPEASPPGDKPSTKSSEQEGSEPGVTKQENGSPSPTDAKPEKYLEDYLPKCLKEKPAFVQKIDVAASKILSKGRLQADIGELKIQKAEGYEETIVQIDEQIASNGDGPINIKKPNGKEKILTREEAAEYRNHLAQKSSTYSDGGGFDVLMGTSKATLGHVTQSAIKKLGKECTVRKGLDSLGSGAAGATVDFCFKDEMDFETAKKTAWKTTAQTTKGVATQVFQGVAFSAAKGGLKEIAPSLVQKIPGLSWINAGWTIASTAYSAQKSCSFVEGCGKTANAGADLVINMGCTMAAQALIPIPFVGAAVGVGCASLLTKGKNWCFSPDLSALMGQRVPAHTLLNQTTDSKNAARQEAQNGLQQFFDGASIRKEDCHSLFRSLAAGILQSGDYAKIREALRGLPEIWGSYAVANALESLDQLEHNGTTIHQIMNDKKLSNAWVKSLRRLSTAWWRNNSEIAKKRLHPHAESLLGHTILDKDLPDAIQKYLETIDDMDDGFLLGGDPELEALSTILNRPIVFIDAAKTVSSDKLSLVRIFKSTQSQFRYSASTDLRNDHKKETLFLLFNNNHYDVLFPNQSWLDECKRKAAIPLMGQLVPPHTLFAPPADGKNMVALHRLEQFFDGALIKGDGHCLFRSLLAGLLKDGNFAKLREAVRGLPQGIVPQEASRTLESLDRLERNQTTVHGIVNDRELSNAWVSVLRRISTAWWRRSSNETKELFRPQLENFLRRTISVNELPQALEEYLKAIENMDENILFGSEPELLALSTALSMPIAVINATETIRSGMVEVLSFSELAQESVSIPSSENLLQLFPGALFVLFQTNHYNALFPKKH